MADLVVHGIDPKLIAAIQREAARSGQPVDDYVKSALIAAAAKRKKQKPYHDLDHLAGTWTRKDYEDFKAVIAPMSEINKEMW